jgi:trimeric autotransporter adhesin
MTITDPPVTSTDRGTAEALFREAHQRRRRRWLVGSIAAIVAIASAAAVVSYRGGGRGSTKIPTPRQRHHGTTTRPPESAAREGLLLNRPQALAVATNGNLLVSNEGSNQVLERLPSGKLIPFAGNGHPGFSGDGGAAASATLNDPEGLAVSTDGTTYVADTGNNRIRAISRPGLISTFAEVEGPTALAIGPTGVLYTADAAGVQTVGSNGVITTIIPSTTGVNGNSVNDISIDGQNVAFFPNALAVSSSGTLYIADFSPKYLLEYSEGVFSLVGPGTVVGGGTYVTPTGLAAARNGDVYVANYGEFSIDRVSGTSSTPIFTAEANSVPGINGFRPSGVAVGPTGEIYADTDGVNGGSNKPALVRLSADGSLHLLAIGRVGY